MPLNSSEVLRLGVQHDLSALAGRERLSFSDVRRLEWDIENAVSISPRWLEACPTYPRMLWRSRSGSSMTLAAGVAASGPLEMLLEMLKTADPGVRVFGGQRFDAGFPSGVEWRAFPSAYYFIPKAEIIHSGGRARLAVNLVPGSLDLDDISEWIGAIGGELPSIRRSVLMRWDQPNFADWSTTLDTSLAAFATGSLGKVVLARKSCLELDEPLGPFSLADIIMGSSPACFHFCIQPAADSGAFLGASPELLYRRIGERLESEAVAGTRPRSLDTVEDARLEAQLLQMSKERLEHRLVVDSLEQTFQQLCGISSNDETPGVLKLSRVQHLRTAFQGILNDGIDDASILKAFHPTPATCGVPTKAAFDFIAKHEGFDRGWYTGPVGCISEDEAEFAVAIRSIHWRGRQLDVFAGAGIVEGSEAEREWMELEDKISGVLNLLSP